MPTARVSDYYLSADTLLTYERADGLEIFRGGSQNATADSAKAAVAFRTYSTSQNDFNMRKQDGHEAGDLLYMFEFRNPPINLDEQFVVVPEPASFLLVSVSALIFVFVRRIFMD
jgi:hypothetical protein